MAVRGERDNPRDLMPRGESKRVSLFLCLSEVRQRALGLAVYFHGLAILSVLGAPHPL